MKDNDHSELTDVEYARAVICRPITRIVRDDFAKCVIADYSDEGERGSPYPVRLSVMTPSSASKAFIDTWHDAQRLSRAPGSDTLLQAICAASLGADDTPITMRDKCVAASVIAWLGTPEGTVFLDACKNNAKHS